MTEEVEGTVRDLSRFGEGIVKTEAGAVFAAGVLPGERVALEGIRKQGGVLRTSKVRIIDRSTQRVDPPCSVVGRCGGCPLMIASPPLQAKFKRGLLEQALRGLPGAEGLSLGWFEAKQVLGYRRRARLTWARVGRGLRLGYHVPRSDQVAEVRTCAVLHPTLDRAFGALRRGLADHLAGAGDIHLAFGATERAVVAIESADAQPPELFSGLDAMVRGGDLDGAALRAGGATSWATWGDAREVRAGVDGEPLHGSIAGFSQAHDEVNRALVARVVELARAPNRHVLELFCGSGNLTVALARGAQSLVAVERDEDAAQACRQNLAARSIQATVRTDDAETYRAPSRPDVAVLDPPRAGAPEAILRLIKLGVGEIVYVSCDPPTLGRDLGTLAKAGYVVTDAVALDMFPQTAHIECVVRVEKR